MKRPHLLPSLLPVVLLAACSGKELCFRPSEGEIPQQRLYCLPDSLSLESSNLYSVWKDKASDFTSIAEREKDGFFHIPMGKISPGGNFLVLMDDASCCSYIGFITFKGKGWQLHSYRPFPVRALPEGGLKSPYEKLFSINPLGDTRSPLILQSVHDGELSEPVILPLKEQTPPPRPALKQRTAHRSLPPAPEGN